MRLTNTLFDNVSPKLSENVSTFIQVFFLFDFFFFNSCYNFRISGFLSCNIIPLSLYPDVVVLDISVSLQTVMVVDSHICDFFFLIHSHLDAFSAACLCNPLTPTRLSDKWRDCPFLAFKFNFGNLTSAQIYNRNAAINEQLGTIVTNLNCLQNSY